MKYKYSYYCGCGHYDEAVVDVYPESEVICVSCGGKTIRTSKVFASETGTSRRRKYANPWPLHSDTLGCNPKQIKEYERMTAEAGIPTRYDKYGRAILTDWKHQKKLGAFIGCNVHGKPLVNMDGDH